MGELQLIVLIFNRCTIDHLGRSVPVVLLDLQLDRMTMDAPGTTLGVGGGHNGASAEVWEHDWILQIPIGYATPHVAYCLGKLKVSLSQCRVPAVVASVTSVTVTALHQSGQTSCTIAYNCCF